MQPQIEIAAVVTAIIAIITIIVGITRHITQVQFALKEERLSNSIREVDQKYADLKAKHDSLFDEIKRAQTIGTQALYKKLEIDDSLNLIAKNMHASAASIYIPLIEHSGSTIEHLIFLSILPQNAQSQALRRKPIPLASFAGRCFISGQPSLIANAKVTKEHFSAADKISGFNTESMINIPLKNEDNTFGVLQLLNKENVYQFDEKDIELAQKQAGSLAVKVKEFTQLPESVKLLGIIPDKENENATIVYCDLTNSSLLLQEMPPSLAANYLNEYLETICEVGLRHGATIENYAGDGVMLRFNVPKRVEKHPYRAIEAAWEMKTAFEKLKSGWMSIFGAVENLYLRIGASYGSVHEVVLGHPQYQMLTVIGQPVHTAAYLCEAGIRSKSIILIDSNLYKQVEYKVFANKLSERTLSKPFRFVDSVYEVEALGGPVSAVG